MIDKESSAAVIVCPMCDERRCVGRYRCKEIAAYIKQWEAEDGEEYESD